MATDLTQLAINAIRILAIDAVQQADSGHPGAPMGLAAVAYTIWTRHLRHAPQQPGWPDRDRFVLSNGHASMLLYSLLHLTGYEAMTLDQIKNFRQWGSLTPGHPERELTPGVEVTTGPLGQGISTAVGLALAEAQLHETSDGTLDHHTYVICSDGDLMEGVSHEAAAIAAQLGLGKLIAVWDDNKITIDGSTDLSFSEDVLARFAAYGWHVSRVDDGNDVDALDAAIAAAKLVTDRPSLIAARTIIGFGSPNKAGKSSSHGSPLGKEEIAKTRAQLGWPYDEPFFVPQAVYDHMSAHARGAELLAAWDAKLAAYRAANPAGAATLERRLAGALPAGWADALPTFAPDAKGMATRNSSGKVLERIMATLPELVGGSADLASSNKTLFPAHGIFDRANRAGQNVHFGVREHGMGAVVNGMTLHGGLRGYGATFLVFSDYMRPALRLAALMHVPSLTVFTHDSIGLGEDGPTHQPIEHLMALRAIPNYAVMRPADANEVRECWIAAIERTSGPSGLVLTRQDVPTFDRAALGSVGDATRGGYILADAPDHNPAVILIGTGSEVAICMEARELLAQQGIHARVVSLPCWELFAAQDKAWRDQVLPPAITARVSVEAGCTLGWERFVGADGVAIGLDHFGASAPFEQLYEHFGLTAARVADVAKGLTT
jgi:transketolase